MAVNATELKIKFEDITNFTKGLNTLDDPLYLDPSESPSIVNMDITRQGAIQTRYGYELVSTIPSVTGAMRGALTYYKTYGTNSGRYLLLFHSNGNVYYITNTNTTPTLIGSYGSDSGMVRGDIFNNLAIFGNGAGNIKKWDASSLADLGGSPPQGKYFGVFQKRLYVAGVSTAPSTLYYSELDDPDDWGTGSNWILVNVGDGTVLTGMTGNTDFLNVFKENNINGVSYEFDSSYNISIPLLKQILSQPSGCICNGSISNVYGYAYFMSSQGIEAYGASINFANLPYPLSLKIDPTIKAINKTQLDNINSICFDNKYYLSCGLNNSPTNSTMLIYDELTKRRFGQDTWTKYQGIPALQFAKFKNTNNQEELYFTSTLEPKLFKFNKTYSDAGSGYYREWTSKTFRFGERTYWRWLDLEGSMTQGSKIYVDIIMDGKQKTFEITNDNLINSGLGVGYVGDNYIGDHYVGGGEAGSTEIQLYRWKKRIMIPSDINHGYTLYFRLRNIDEGQGWLFNRYRLAYSIDPEDPTYARAY